ncbi:MAG: hypothetical protein KJ558_09445 [Gammaproteobacteria bacterium]|nr:hypothetical protein [Gammaproteobacteria bacterium]MBU1655030.1 hypothetical protein [Gammaproteobacteria bacterium]MBU1961527.1 hypothetical protein [Gammaproteobacteria bacterium]
MSYQENIRSSSLRFVLRKLAVQLASQWFECAMAQYDVADIEGLGFDEIEVENDFVEELSSAIDSLVNDKSMEKKSIPGWSFGYICGHIKGALDVKWSDRYLIELSDKYTDLMKLRTIIEILRVDSDISRKIEIIYGYLIGHKDKASVDDDVLPDNVISLIQKGRLESQNAKTYKSEFEAYFRDLFAENYMSLINTYRARCCPELTRCLSEREIMSLVGSEHFA